MEEAQLLADFVCKRKAEREKKTLEPNYWNSIVWKRHYQQQVIAAHSLLKVYPFRAIMSALKHKDINWVYSLRSKQIIPYIKDEVSRMEYVREEAEKSKVVVNKEGKNSVGKSFGGKKGRLGGLD